MLGGRNVEMVTSSVGGKWWVFGSLNVWHVWCWGDSWSLAHAGAMAIMHLPGWSPSNILETNN